MDLVEWLDEQMDKVDSLLGEEKGWTCEVCKNDKGRIVVVCECGFNLQICLPCYLLDRSVVEEKIVTHGTECEVLKKAVRVSEAHRGP